MSQPNLPPNPLTRRVCLALCAESPGRISVRRHLFVIDNDPSSLHANCTRVPQSLPLVPNPRPSLFTPLRCSVPPPPHTLALASLGYFCHPSHSNSSCFHSHCISTAALRKQVRLPVFACPAHAPGVVAVSGYLTLLDDTFTHPFGDVSTHPSGFIASEYVRSVEILLSVVKVHNLCIFSESFADSNHRCPAIPLDRAPSPPLPPAHPVYHLLPRDHPCSLPMPAATTHLLHILKHASLPSPPCQRHSSAITMFHLDRLSRFGSPQRTAATPPPPLSPPALPAPLLPRGASLHVKDEP
ncbi:hypothetical protein B0H13DRAFT_2377009 [Mycena leptocephala]|nr:hypothetical protein B0H13DRAFT_2377009 [Mycena leptocephala]